MVGSWQWKGVAAVALVGLLVVVTVAPASGAQQEPEADNTVTRIEVGEDGSALWQVHVRTRLDTNESVSTYEAFQSEFRENRSRFLDPYRDRLRSIVASAANHTGREMEAREFSAETSIQEVPRRWGVVTYEFTWEGFAERQDGALVVGDAFEDGFYIERNDTLQVVPPEGYVVGEADVDPAPDHRDDVLTWNGERSFGEDRPRVRMEPADARGGIVAVLLGVGLVPLIGGSVLLTIAGAVVANRLVGGAGAAGGSEDGPVPDREQVRQLLAANGGQLRQSEIVEEVDWSKSKVSRVIGKLEDDGVVEKTRIGRENVVELVED